MTDETTAVLGDLLMRAARAQRRRWGAVLAPMDLTPHVARALGTVVREEQLRLSDLADRLQIAPRSATEVADALQERGLVERTPDPTDRRAVLLRPTAEGLRVQHEVTAARAADSVRFYGRLAAADRAALARILATLEAAGDEVTTPAG